MNSPARQNVVVHGTGHRQDFVAYKGDGDRASKDKARWLCAIKVSEPGTTCGCLPGASSAEGARRTSARVQDGRDDGRERRCVLGGMSPEESVLICP